MIARVGETYPGIPMSGQQCSRRQRDSGERLTCFRKSDEFAVHLAGLANQRYRLLDRLFEIEPTRLCLHAGGFVLADRGRHIGSGSEVM